MNKLMCYKIQIEKNIERFIGNQIYNMRQYADVPNQAYV